MATYAISFTIDYDDHGGWERRYDSLMDEIRKCKRVWLETTSFCLVETDKSLSDFEFSLYLTEFDTSKDKLILIDVSYADAIARGKLSQTAMLQALLPGIRMR